MRGSISHQQPSTVSGEAHVSKRLGLPVVSGSIELADGRKGSWRMVGAVEAMAEPWLPFFISYDQRSERSPLAETPPEYPTAWPGSKWRVTRLGCASG